LTAPSSGPVDFWDRVRNRIELLGARSDPPARSFRLRPLEAVLRDATDALGRDCVALARDPALAKVRSATRGAGDAPFPEIYDATDALASLCFVFARALAPRVAVETGVANGVTTSHILAALPAGGTLYSIDWAPGGRRRHRPVGRLIPDELRGAWKLEVGPSRRVLPRLVRRTEPIGLFVHDSLHTYRTMRTELAVVTPHMRRPSAVVVDDVQTNAAFLDWSDSVKPDYVTLVETELDDHPVGVALLL
jgi:hypothetical protein